MISSRENVMLKMISSMMPGLIEMSILTEVEMLAMFPYLKASGTRIRILEPINMTQRNKILGFDHAEGGLIGRVK
jgi:hypothetical protein